MDIKKFVIVLFKILLFICNIIALGKLYSHIMDIDNDISMIKRAIIKEYIKDKI